MLVLTRNCSNEKWRVAMKTIKGTLRDDPPKEFTIDLSDEPGWSGCIYLSDVPREDREYYGLVSHIESILRGHNNGVVPVIFEYHQEDMALTWKSVQFDKSRVHGLG